jgi:RNA polymerase sigma-32 factor
MSMSQLTLTASQGLEARSWSLLPPLGNLDAYITAVNRFPLLTLEQEQSCAKRLRDEGDLEAAGQLILSHLRLVVSISRQYLGYGLAHADLIQEGNVGLMKAVKRFDPSQGTRLVTYAIHWIKAEIHEYILRNWRMVKVATTKAQRKLFFNLRSMKSQLLSKDAALHGDLHGQLTQDQIDDIANSLQVKREDVIEMESRMVSGDVVIDPLPDEEREEGTSTLLQLSDSSLEPTRVLEAQRRERLSSHGVQMALEALDTRSRRIVEERWLKVNDDGSGGMTLHELAAEFGVSAERVRQIEASALKKMRKAIETV